MIMADSVSTPSVRSVYKQVLQRAAEQCLIDIDAASVAYTLDCLARQECESTSNVIDTLGFDMDDKRLRRAGLDYHEFAHVQRHANLEALAQAQGHRRWLCCSTRGAERYDRVQYQTNDLLVFGPETRGLPQAVLDAQPAGQRVRIPMRPDNRSLNLSNAVAVIAYEAWRQLGFIGGR